MRAGETVSGEIGAGKDQREGVLHRELRRIRQTVQGDGEDEQRSDKKRI